MLESRMLLPDETRTLIHRRIDQIFDTAQRIEFRDRRGHRIAGEHNGAVIRELTSKGDLLLAYDLEAHDG